MDPGDHQNADAGEEVPLGPMDGPGSDEGDENESNENESHNTSIVHAWGRAYWRFKKNSLDRRLTRGQITGIAFSGTIGKGIFVTSGELIGISGSLGCVLAFIFAGVIIIVVMRSLAEMVSVRPLSGALIDYPYTFVDEALGFAVGVTYWFAQCMSMATLTSAAVRAADNFREEPLNKKQKSGIIVGLCALTLLSNVCGVRLYGNIERVVKWLKLSLIIGLCVLMIGVSLGLAMEPGAPRHSSKNYTKYSFPPGLRWNGFANATHVEDGTGIRGEWGQFLAVWTCTIYAMFACMGGDIVIVTAGEAEKPHKDLPAAARFMYLAPIGFYILLSSVLGSNINYLNPDLAHPWANDDELMSHSPFIIVLKHTSIKVLPKFLNGCFLFATYTAANTGLFVSSRTLFALSRTFGNKFISDTLHLGKTNPGHTPVPAILVCSVFGFLAFLGLADQSLNQPILSLSAFFTGAIACVYGSECVAYLRFKRGLTLHDQSEARLIWRDSPTYKGKHYRAHWQPLCAIFGLVACIAIIIFSGWPAIYLLRARDSLSTKDKLKSKGDLGADVVGAYAGPFLFFSLYFGYKFIKGTEIRQFRDFEMKYFPAEFRDYIPDRPKENGSIWELSKFILHEIWTFVY